MKKYPSDLSDKQWKLIEDELPRSPGKRGFPQKHSRRDLMNARCVKVFTLQSPQTLEPVAPSVCL